MLCASLNKYKFVIKHSFFFLFYRSHLRCRADQTLRLDRPGTFWSNWSHRRRSPTRAFARARETRPRSQGPPSPTPPSRTRLTTSSGRVPPTSHAARRRGTPWQPVPAGTSPSPRPWKPNASPPHWTRPPGTFSGPCQKVSCKNNSQTHYFHFC